MRKLIIEILLGLSLPTAVFHTQLSSLFAAEQPVTKQISFSIARDTNYNEKVYDLSRATIRVVIFKVRDHKQIVVWNKVYDTQLLREYPTMRNALKQTVTVSNIWDRKEKLYVTYYVTYNTNGNVVKLENGTSLAKGEKTGSLFIGL